MYLSFLLWRAGWCLSCQKRDSCPFWLLRTYLGGSLGAGEDFLLVSQGCMGHETCWKGLVGTWMLPVVVLWCSANCAHEGTSETAISPVFCVLSSAQQWMRSGGRDCSGALCWSQSGSFPFPRPQSLPSQDNLIVPNCILLCQEKPRVNYLVISTGANELNLQWKAVISC